MGKRTLLRGIAFGAIAGGLTALLDPNTRYFIKETYGKTKETVRYYSENPSEAVRSVRETVAVVNKNLSKGVDTAMTELNKLEQSLQEKDNKDKHIELK